MQGWIKLHREVVNSDIYKMQPLYLRVFERLLLEANHTDKEIPYKNEKKLIQKGERLTSIGQIAEWVGWYERGVFKTPNKKTISGILNWLIDNGMITIYSKAEGNAQYTHYNIVNYSVYQNENDIEVTVSKRLLDTNKNVKNDKNIKKEHTAFFEKMWAKYPLKKGKSNIKDADKKKLFEMGDEVLRCMERYVSNKEDWKAYQQGGTFFKSGYTDYTDEEYSLKQATTVKRSIYKQLKGGTTNATATIT